MESVAKLKKEFLEYLVKSIVDHPDDVKVERKIDEMGVLLTVKLGEGDAGVVIGKQGQSINAIRSVINIVGRKNQAKVNVKLDVPEVRRGIARPESNL